MVILERVLLWRSLRFSVVGASGVVVHSAALYLVHDVAGLTLEWASPIAIAIAILHNFRLNNVWTFGAHPHRDGRDYLGRLLRYYFSSSLGALLNYVVLLSLVRQLKWEYLIANLAGIAAGMLSNFLLSEFWVFRRRREA
jgi:dolichol-phosphate mannosyltransferase